jgi:predicted ATPase/GAF domain-containing protein/HPt (histidine-containing phosphotransfer) domain-containing protein
MIARAVLDDGTTVLLKSAGADLPLPAELESLRQEARVLDRLQGLPVPKLLGIEESGTSVSLVLADEGHEPLATDQPWAIDRFLDVAIELARALRAIHARNVLHLDVTPYNVVHRPADGDLRIIDFDSALIDVDGHVIEEPVGTPAYAAPEQTGRVDYPIDGRADLYALGISFFELLTGRTPFIADDRVGWMHAHLSKTPPTLREVRADVPEMIEAIVARLLEKQPDDRYPSAAGLLNDLDRCRRQWSAHKVIAPFELGRSGATGITPPERPIGRDDEIAALLAGLDGRMVVVTGSEGSGKSTFVDIARSAFLDSARGPDGGPALVLDGSNAKDVDAPAGRLTTILAEFARDLLVRSDDQVELWRDRLVEATAPHTTILTELVPEFETIIGPVNGAAGAGPDDRNRVLAITLETIGQHHRVLVVIDDADDADADSLAIVAELLSSSRAPLLTGLVASTELNDRFGDMADSPSVTSTTVELPPLSLRQITDLLQATLGAANRPLHELAAVLEPATGGSPGLLLEVLDRQAAAGALNSDDDGVWAWSDESFAGLAHHQSRVELLLAEFHTMTEVRQAVVGYAACLPAPFNHSDIDAATGKTTGVAAALSAARDHHRLIKDVEGGMAFVDESLRSAIEETLTEQVRATNHLKVAAWLYRQAIDSDDGDRDLVAGVFAIAGHLDAASTCDWTDDDRRMAIHVYRLAADRAQRTGSHDLAYRHHDRTLSILDALSSPHDDDPKRFTVALARADAAFQAADIDLARRHAEALLAEADGALNRGRVRRLLAAIASHQGRVDDVLSQAMAGLDEIGVVSPSADTVNADKLVDLSQFLNAGGATELVDLPPCQDPSVELTMDLLLVMASAAMATDPWLFMWTEVSLVELTYEHGLVPASAQGVAGAGLVAAETLNRPDQAALLADAALALAERFSPHPVEVSVKHLCGSYLQHLRDPIDTCIATLDQAWQAGVLGDVEHAAYAANHRAGYLEVSGAPLNEQADAIDAAVDYARTVGSDQGLAIGRVQRPVVSALSGEHEAATATDGIAAVLDSRGGPDDAVSYHAYLGLAVIEWWHGRPTQAWRWARQAAGLTELVHGVCNEPTMHLITTLAAVAMADQNIADSDLPGLGQDETMIDVARASVQRLDELAATNAEYHGPAAALARAELARFDGAPIDQLVAGYDEAVKASGSRFVQIRALATERHADLWRSNGHNGIARGLYREAMTYYERWQCKPKVASLAAAHPGLFERRADAEAAQGTGTMSADSGLDMASVTKATRAIASEVTADGLFSALMNMLVESAGAQTGALVSIEDGELHVEASIDADGVTCTDRRPLDDVELARTVVTYTRRTGELLVLGNARRDPRFRNDRHVQTTGTKSAACVPIALRGELYGMLYLENNALRKAFTPKHVELLEVIAGQAAVSIQHVRVFEELEARVAARTDELALKNRQVQALLDNLPEAVLTIDNDRLVEPQYSARAPEILRVDDPAGRDVIDVLFEQSSIDAEEQARCTAALDFSFGADEFMASLNWPHLVRKFTRSIDGETRSYAIDWAGITDEDNVVQRMLAAVRDTTELEALQEQATAATRYLVITQQIFGAGVSDYSAFATSETERLDEVRQRLATIQAGGGSPTRDDLDFAFRGLHTIKGNSRLLGLNILAGRVHAAEEPICAMRDGEDVELSVALEAVDEVGECIELHNTLLERTIGGSTAQADKLLNDVRALLSDSADERGEPTRSPGSANSRTAEAIVGDLRRLLEVDGYDLAKVIEEAGRALPSLATELGKVPPTVTIDGPAVTVVNELHQPIRDAMVHLLRNAVDHGLESTEDRRNAGKPEAGTISVRLQPTGADLRCSVSDDGRGLALGRLRERARPGAGDAEVADLIFQAGLSTKEQATETSGRGVGMDAVRSFLEELGCTVGLSFSGPEVDGFRPFAIDVVIPSIHLVEIGT